MHLSKYLILPAGILLGDALDRPAFAQSPLNASPSVAARSGPLNAPAPTRRPRAMQYAWFWNMVSPNPDGTGLARLEHAFGSLQQARQAGRPVPRPRESDLKALAERHGADILRATAQTAVSPDLVLAVISVESAGRINAISPAGAQGLMQLMPATAQRFGVSDSFNPTQNILGGVAYLDFLINLFEKDPILVLAGYNAGENAVRRHNGVPPFAETRDYVPQVLAALQLAQNLCPQGAESLSVFCTR